MGRPPRVGADLAGATHVATVDIGSGACVGPWRFMAGVVAGPKPQPFAHTVAGAGLLLHAVNLADGQRGLPRTCHRMAL